MSSEAIGVNLANQSRLSHIEINTGDYPQAIRFYDRILKPLGFERLVCTRDFTSFSDGFLKLILCPVEEQFRGAGFHRKRIGLNHLAFYAKSKAEVDQFYAQTLKANGIASLYQEGADGDDDYYSVLFEDLDRMKLEVVYSPQYCKRDCWPNTVVSDFDPYQEV